MNTEQYVESESVKDILTRARHTIFSLKQSIMAHPDHTEGSEFDDMTTTAQEMENEISEFLNETEP